VEIRKGMPDAAGLVIATDHDDARAYAALLRKLTGKPAVVVLSDDPAASRKIGKFATSDDRWLVAVRMVSEGVDIPRLAVGVYATAVSTAMFFAQAVGRFVRARRRGETASVFLPSVPVLLGYAAELEAERDHVLKVRPAEQDEELALARAQQQRDHPDEPEAPFLALAATAHFDRVLYDGGEFGASPEDEDFIGLPGLLEPEQVAVLLRQRHADQVRKQRADPAAGPAAPEPAAAGPSAATARETLTSLRKELNGLVAAWHHRTGQPHGAIHAELRRTCGGPSVPQATAVQLGGRIDTIRRWNTSRH
jgi:superfamily II DNA or RNA helicase